MKQKQLQYEAKRKSKMNRYVFLFIVFTCLFSCNESDSEKENEKVKKQEYSGAGYVTGLMQPDADIEFLVEVHQTGNYLMVIRYRNTGTADGIALLFINGVLIENHLELPVQSELESWQTTEAEIFLQNGINRIILQNSAEVGGLSDLDFIEVNKK